MSQHPKPVVVVVDDNPRILSAIRRLLRDLPLDVRLAECAEAALRECEVVVPDVIVADYDMPDLDGMSLLRRVLERHPACRAILHTAAIDAVHADGAQADGVEVLPKGEDPVLLRQKIMALTSAYRDAKSSSAL